MSKELNILWIKDNHRENLEFDENFPEIISDEIISRLGRAGRGRLWVPSEIDLSGIDWIDNELTSELGRYYGGIVFESKYLEQVQKAPLGDDTIITDLDLNVIE